METEEIPLLNRVKVALTQEILCLNGSNSIPKSKPNIRSGLDSTVTDRATQSNSVDPAMLLVLPTCKLSFL